MNNKYIECRVFKSTVFWAEVMFYFPIDISFEDIKSNQKTSFLVKGDYVGKFNFHFAFLLLQDKQKIKNKDYYYTYYIPENQK